MLNSPIAVGLVALAATVIGALIASQAERRSADLADAAAARQRQLDVAKYKGDVLRSLKDFDRDTAEALLVHTLKPIDSEEGYKSFYNDYQNLLAKLQASKSDRAGSLAGTAILDSASVATAKDPRSLVALFVGDERQQASSKLARLYGSQKRAVVEALVSGIQPSTSKTAYRVNLYVAYTLGRISPSWEGSLPQREAIAALKASPEYAEATFQVRVNEALDNFREIGSSERPR
jgi:hypothetical protein